MLTKLTASVRNQLRFAFAIVIILSFVSTAVAIWRLQVLADDTNELTHRPLAKERLVSSWLLNISMSAKRTAAIARASDGELAKLFADETVQQSARTSELQKQVGDMLDTNEEKVLFAQIGEARQQYLESRDRVTALKAEGKAEEARALYDKSFAGIMARYIDKVKELLALQQKSIGARTGEVLGSAHQSSTVLVCLCLATLIFSVGAAHRFARALFRRLGGEPALATSVASEIAAGNLRVEVKVADGDQASLMAALKRMRDSLAGIVGQVREGTTAIGVSISEMSSEAQELSRRTESQAASLEETASSIEQLTQGIQHSTDNAEQANGLAAQASRVARQGGAMVGQLVETMGAINESSSRIADIIGVIDGIAFQTNILALNAAVEAARAGEQGRGFAVVAGEVRALAQRSAAAAKEIKVLIDDSTGRVTEGSTLAGKAGETMKGIVAGIDRVSGIMNDIVASSREQASGIAQVNQAITQMDGATQQNAALVEESAAATLAMQEQSHKLKELVSVFRVDVAAVRAPAAAAAARPALPAQKPAPAAAKPAAARAARKAPPAKPAKPAAVAEDWEEF
ncbi:methyl-accepting chemotaxis protein [Massilia aerilata]|uniref:Methyl-accepting chemotaxis protein n=1 Tax=Massilia aerilata TaxID=453817 RepID=A0ABW0S0Q1_9BURK